MNFDFRQCGLDVWQGGPDFQQVGLEFRQVGKMLVQICEIKWSKLGRFSFVLSLPKYDNPSQVNRWSQFYSS